MALSPQLQAASSRREVVDQLKILKVLVSRTSRQLCFEFVEAGLEVRVAEYCDRYPLMVVAGPASAVVDVAGSLVDREDRSACVDCD